MKNRKGKIRISRQFFNDDLETLQQLFANFIPIHINNDSWDRYISYTGWSALFDEIEEASVAPIPEYDAIVTVGEENKVTISFKRVS